MATRFYFESSTWAGVGAPITPAADAIWDQFGGASPTRKRMSPEHKGSTLTGSNVNPTGTAPWDGLVTQFISQPLASGLTLSGPFSYVFRCLEASTGSDVYLQVVIKVFQSNGTLRGTCFSGHTSASVSASVGVFNEEMATTAATRIGNGIAFTSAIAASAGDYIVAEIGVRRCAATTGSHQIVLGDPVGTADYALTSGLTTTLVPWLEISDNVTFVDPAVRLYREGMDVMVTPTPNVRLYRQGIDVMITPSTAPRLGWGRLLN